MKNLLFLLLCLCAYACQTPQTQSAAIITPEETQIAKDLIQGVFDDVWGGVDSTKIANYHTEDFIILENGEVWDNDRIKKFIRQQLAYPNRAKRTNSMDFISIDKYGESIQMAYNNYATFSQADTIVGKGQWLESALAIKTKQGWKLKMMHSTWNLPNE